MTISHRTYRWLDDFPANLPAGPLGRENKFPASLTGKSAQRFDKTWLFRRIRRLFRVFPGLSRATGKFARTLLAAAQKGAALSRAAPTPSETLPRSQGRVDVRASAVPAERLRLSGGAL